MTALYGALFGLFTYATYDLTNYGTLKAWTVTLVPSDILRDMAMTAVVSALGMLAGRATSRWLAVGGMASASVGIFYNPTYGQKAVR